MTGPTGRRRSRRQRRTQKAKRGKPPGVIKVGTYSAATSRATNTEFEPSATEPVSRCFCTVTAPKELVKFKIEVGGVALPGNRDQSKQMRQ